MLRRLSIVSVTGLALFVGGSLFAQCGSSGSSGSSSPSSHSGRAHAPKQDGKPAAPPPKKPEPAKPAPAPTEKATVPFFGNASCPVDAKAASRELFADVDGQRVYVCSDTCKAAVAKDGKAMLAKAYPNVTPLVSKGCATCSKPLPASGAKEAVFEGRRVSLCCDGCASAFKASPWLVMVQITWPDAKDAKNSADPIDGKPVDPAVLAVYKRHILHFSSQKSLASFEKDPDATLAKLKIASTP